VTLAGGGERRPDVASGAAVRHHPGTRVPIRRVRVRDADGEREPRAFLCTDPAVEPATILGWFVRRRRRETTFEAARRHLGAETRRQWSELAILRTTPALLGLLSPAAVRAAEIQARCGLPLGAACRCPERTPTFSDAPAAARAELWRGDFRHITARPAGQENSRRPPRAPSARRLPAPANLQSQAHGRALN
jgi:hypothetical protein